MHDLLFKCIDNDAPVSHKNPNSVLLPRTVFEKFDVIRDTLGKFQHKFLREPREIIVISLKKYVIRYREGSYRYIYPCEPSVIMAEAKLKKHDKRDNKAK
jgi:hypothetical protein